MNSYLKYGLFFLGGLLVGSVATAAISRGKLDFKPLMSEVVSRGIQARDAIASKVEILKEDCEDITAMAQQKVEERRLKKLNG